MATITKIKKKTGTAYRLQYMVNHKRYSVYYAVGANLDKIKAHKKRLEAEIAEYRAGMTDTIPGLDGSERKRERSTLAGLTADLAERRRQEVSPLTLKRNLSAMRILMDCVGPDLRVSALSRERIEQFKRFRLNECGATKKGINKDLVNIRTMLNYAVDLGLIHEAPIRKMPFFPKERKLELPKVFTPQEIIELKKQFTDGELWLAFCLFIYTGARRGEICQRRVGDGTGLRWRDIDWMQNQIKVYGKSEEKIKPMNALLKKELAAEMRSQQQSRIFDVDGLVVSYIGDTVSAKIRKALRTAGLYQEGRGVHAFRHTFATEMLKANDGNIRLVQELLDHKDIGTTQIYTHIVAEAKKKAVAKLPY